MAEGTEADPIVIDDPVHCWFGLTYASYLVLPRLVLQSMPGEWQRRFVDCLREVDATFGDRITAPDYTVQARDDRGRFVADPLRDYRRDRARLPARARHAAGGTD